MDLNFRHSDYINKIKRLRLVFNTIEDLGDFIGLKSIASNDIRKDKKSNAMAYQYFASIYSKVKTDFGVNIDIEDILGQYEKATAFFIVRKKLRGITSAEVSLLLNSYFDNRAKATTFILELVQEIKEHKVDISILALILLKIIPHTRQKGLTDIVPKEIEQKLENLLSFFGEYIDKANLAEYNIVEKLKVCYQALERFNKKVEIRNPLFLICIAKSFFNVYAGKNNLTSSFRCNDKIGNALSAVGFWRFTDGPHETFLEIKKMRDFSLLTSYKVLRVWSEERHRIRGVISYKKYKVALLNERLIAISNLKFLPQYIVDQKFFPKSLFLTNYSQSKYSLKSNIYAPIESIDFENLDKNGLFAQTLSLSKMTLAKARSFIESPNYDIIPEEPSYKIKITQLDAIISPNCLYVPKDRIHYYKIPKSIHEGLKFFSSQDGIVLVEIEGKEYFSFFRMQFFIPIDSPLIAITDKISID